MRNARMDESQAGIKIARRNISNLRYADDSTLITESKEELKSLWIRVKDESKKVDLNSTFKKLRSWHSVPLLYAKQIGEKWQQWQVLFSRSPKSLWTETAARTLKDSPWKESYKKHREHIKKQRPHFSDKRPCGQSHRFCSSHIWM